MGQVPAPVDPLVKGSLRARIYIESLTQTMKDTALVEPEQYAAEFFECVSVAILAQVAPLTRLVMNNQIGVDRFLIAVGAYTTLVTNLVQFLKRHPVRSLRIELRKTTEKHIDQMRRSGRIARLSASDMSRAHKWLNACERELEQLTMR